MYRQHFIYNFIDMSTGHKNLLDVLKINTIQKEVSNKFLIIM